MQAYTLPYVIGHAQLNHCQYFRFALMRALCYCSNVYDFDQERLYMELTFLVHGFPLQLIEFYRERFFRQLKNSSFHKQLLDQSVYNQLRSELFRFIDQHKILSAKNHEYEENNRFFHLYYLYEWGPRRQFNRQFRELWSKYIAQYPMLSGNVAKITLSTKHLHSLNALLAREKPSDLVSKRKKIYL